MRQTDPDIILKTVFGYDEFRPLQSDIIQNVLNRKYTLVIMPTGGGKSLCYQIPALIFDGLTVVVSPLISLMTDQVEQLVELGVPALFLNSTLSNEEYSKNISLVKQNKVKLLYLAPEALLKPGLLDMLTSVKVDCLTIDEAHCISEWGHDFRPEYRQLADVRKYFKNSVCMALTATATPRVQKDIKNSLNFESSNEYIGSFNRVNLFINIIPKADPNEQTISFLKQYPDQSGIIYCFSRKQVDNLCDNLTGEGFSVRPYHAGLSDEDRKKNQELFIKDDVQIIVATIAFGMGINKPNVRFVIHYDLPKSIENYYQEIGRAGRDGLRSECLLLFSYADIRKIKFFINQKQDDEKRIANIHLNALLQFAETDICRRIPLLTYFGETFCPKHCEMCDNCLSEDTELTDISTHAQKFLSCVKRTGEIFGAGHIIDVLRGSEAKKILKFGHQDLSTYGIGKDLSKKQWFSLSRQFLHKGLMSQDMEYGGLKLTSKAWNVFKGDEKVFGIHEIEEVKPAGKITDFGIDFDKILFDELRKLRKEIADDAGVPPYVIFPDKTLMEMAAYFPRQLNSLRNIHGIGEQKLKKYGFIFLEIICNYCEENGIEENPKPVRQKQKSQKMTGKRRHIVIGEAYSAGQPIDEIMSEYKIKLLTVLDHLFKYFLEGNAIRPDGLLSLSTVSALQQKVTLKAFDTLGYEFLSPVYKALDEKVDYENLKVLRLYYLGSKDRR
ncbi:MAG: DNA helicase RecQ [Desulfobacterales bacterium]|nr:DNA helicase RecQ [Desulfobacterales bacterium]